MQYFSCSSKPQPYIIAWYNFHSVVNFFKTLKKESPIDVAVTHKNWFHATEREFLMKSFLKIKHHKTLTSSSLLIISPLKTLTTKDRVSEKEREREKSSLNEGKKGT